MRCAWPRHTCSFSADLLQSASLLSTSGHAAVRCGACRCAGGIIGRLQFPNCERYHEFACARRSFGGAASKKTSVGYEGEENDAYASALGRMRHTPYQPRAGSVHGRHHRTHAGAGGAIDSRRRRVARRSHRHRLSAEPEELDRGEARGYRFRRLDLCRGHRQVPGHQYCRVLPAHSGRNDHPRNQRRRQPGRHPRAEQQLHEGVAEQCAGRSCILRSGGCQCQP